MSGDTPHAQLKIDMNSPFYLGPQDRPGDFITAARFNGENYDEWAGEIETALQARRKFGFLDGTITGPEPPCTQSDWVTIHAMLVSWIMNTITHEVKTSLSKYKDAKRLWDTLKERFALVSGPRIQQLKASIARCEQTKNMTVATYYGKLTSLWEELHTHEPLITCSCCTRCTAGREHEIRREKDKLHQFLMGLNMGLNSEYHGQIRSSVLSQDPLPSFNRAYQLVVQDERVGYPDWWGDRPKPNGSTGRNKGRGGNTNGPRANATVAETSGLERAAAQTFTAEQWKALASVFGNMTLSNDRLSGSNEGADWNGK